MSHLPAIPEVILLDYIPQPGELQGIISGRLPGLATPQASRRGRERKEHPTTMGRVEGIILLDFLPPLGALQGVIRGHRTGAGTQPRKGGHY